MFRGKQNTADETVLKPGALMTDQTVFGGEFNGQLIFAMPADVQDDEGGGNLLMGREQALALLKKINAEGRLGHSDWDLATPAEMQMLIRNSEQANLTGTFNMTSTKDIDLGEGPATVGWYLTSGIEKNGEKLLIDAVIACKNEILPVLTDDVMSVRFIRREQSSANVAVASAARVRAKSGKKGPDGTKTLSKMLRKPDEAAAILAQVLAGVTEQKKHAFLDSILHGVVLNSHLYYSSGAFKVTKAILEAGANPNAEFGGVKGEMLARSWFTDRFNVAKCLYSHGANLDDALNFMATTRWSSGLLTGLKSWWEKAEAEKTERKPIAAYEARPSSDPYKRTLSLKG